jgi:hypothetical protein
MSTGKDVFEKSPADRTLSRSSSSSLATWRKYHAENVILGSGSGSTGLCRWSMKYLERNVLMSTSGSLEIDSSSLLSFLTSAFSFFSFLVVLFFLLSTSLSEPLLELVSDDEETGNVSNYHPCAHSLNTPFVRAFFFRRLLVSSPPCDLAGGIAICYMKYVTYDLQ